jgi:hypothetical protein
MYFLPHHFAEPIVKKEEYGSQDLTEFIDTDPIPSKIIDNAVKIQLDRLGHPMGFK